MARRAPVEREASPALGPLLAIEAEDGGTYAIDGEPVWPVRNAHERDALERMVSALGNRVELRKHASPCALSGPEVVVGLGPAAFDDARLYAHLSRRACSYAATQAELSALPAPTVVVTTFEYINEELFDALYDGCHAHDAPGVIFNFPGSDLRSQVLARSATLRCAPPSTRRLRVDVMPKLQSLGRVVVGNYTALGALTEAHELREELAKRPSLLTLSTHSDGIDALLPRGLVLCPMDRIPEQTEQATAPSCNITGTCHRRNVPVSEALAEGSLVSPADIAADVFIHDTCWGLYPAQGVTAPAWSFAKRLLENWSIGALITSWRVLTSDVTTTVELFHEVASGVPLGRALGNHLRSEEARKLDHKLCLIGDPGFRLPLRSMPNVLARHIRKVPSRHVPPRQLADLALLRGMIVQARAYQKPGDPDDADVALAATAKYEGALLAGAEVEIGAPSLGSRFRRAVLGYFTQRYTDTSIYHTAYSVDVRATDEPGRCGACGRRITRWVRTLRIADCRPRRTSFCPSCGAIDDCPLDRHLALRVERDGWVHLEGDRPREHWDARLVVDPHLAILRRSWTWPADSSGAALEAFQVPEPLPTVPLRVSVVLLRDGCELNTVGCSIHRIPEEQARPRRKLPLSSL